MTERPIIFVSCGQVTDDEKQLGKDVCTLIRDLTKYDPYFAENQSRLEGVSQNILGKLNQSAGMITIMHPRGEVLGLADDKHVRASIWIEQEIAIASFLTQIERRELPILAYVHQRIKREGLREQLILNPYTFESNDQILDHLRVALPSWVIGSPKSGPPVEMTLEYEKRLCDRQQHNYRLTVRLKNTGATVIDSYHLDLLFPTALLLSKNQPRSFEISATDEGSLFRVSTREHQLNALYPGDTNPVLTIDYFVDHNICHRQAQLLNESVKATLYVEGYAPLEKKRVISEMQEF